MNGYVEAGYAAVTIGLGGYSVWLKSKVKRLRPVKIVSEAEGRKGRTNRNDS